MEHLEIKVIICEGVVLDVRKSLKDADVSVEIIDVNKDYEDYDALYDYQDKIFNDPDLVDCDYTIAHFESDDSE